MTTLTAAPVALYQVQLEDELPAIGSGHRLIFAKEGHKWAFVLCPFTANTVKIPLAAWRGIKKSAPMSPGAYICDYLRGQLRLLDRAPTAFEKAALGE